MSGRDLVRLVVLGFFIGLNIILGAYFLMTVVGTGRLPTGLSAFLQSGADKMGIAVNEPFQMNPSFSTTFESKVDLSAEEVINLANDFRRESKLYPVEESLELSSAAAVILEEMEAGNFEEKDEEELDVLLEGVLEEVNYYYSSVSQSAVMGPVTIDELERHWQDFNVTDLLTADNVSEMGVSVKIVEKDNQFVGMTVMLLAEPRAERAAQTSSASSGPQNTVPNISDQEVLQALNQYRSDHGIHQLIQNEHLCQYAEKRVQDLVAHGGLDNHAGFQADFADYDNLPEPIKQYPGGRIGENLAHQFCRNMTTGDSFIAETGTALIEWCFDSSTKGHREAQLDPAYNNVCVRHSDSMYVVIFGE